MSQLLRVIVTLWDGSSLLLFQVFIFIELKLTSTTTCVTGSREFHIFCYYIGHEKLKEKKTILLLDTNIIYVCRIGCIMISLTIDL
jgi:hypothetical protein